MRRHHLRPSTGCRSSSTSAFGHLIIHTLNFLLASTPSVHYRVSLASGGACDNCLFKCSLRFLVPDSTPLPRSILWRYHCDGSSVHMEGADVSRVWWITWVYAHRYPLSFFKTLYVSKSMLVRFSSLCWKLWRILGLWSEFLKKPTIWSVDCQFSVCKYLISFCYRVDQVFWSDSYQRLRLGQPGSKMTTKEVFYIYIYIYNLFYMRQIFQTVSFDTTHGSSLSKITHVSHPN